MASSRWRLIFLLLSFCGIISAKTSVLNLEFAGAEENSSCSLEMSPDSLDRFTEAVEQNFLWIYLKINAQNVTRSDEWSQLLDPDVITWADDVTYPLLKYPFDFDTLSLDILNSNNINIYLNASPSNCTIELGSYAAFSQIYEAFYKATRNMKHAKHGVVCFPVKFEVTGADIFFGIQRESAGYLCCDNSIDPKGSSRSTRNICYVIKQAWLLNICMIFGFVAFCFFSFYIKYIAAGTSPLNPPPPKPERSGLGDPSQDGNDSDEWVELNGNHDMGLLSLLKSILCCTISSKIISTFRRLVFVVLSLSILYIRIILEYYYNRVILQAFMDKGVPLGYLAIPFGFEQSCKNWRYIMGGPYILFLIYYISAGFLVYLLEKVVTGLKCDIHFLEKYGLQHRKSRIAGKSGFDKLHAIMIAQFYMLFNGKYWASFLEKWSESYWCEKMRLVVLGFLTCLYYGVPVLFLFISGLRFICVAFKHTKGKCLTTAAIFLSISYCLACLTFLYFFIHSLMTIFQVIAFTFIGIVVNPSSALVVVIAGSTIFLYLVDYVLAFSRSYSDLSRQTILAVQKISKENEGRPFEGMLRYRHGIPMVPTKLFLFVTDRHLPIQREVLRTVVKLIFIGNFLGFSAYIISSFGKNSNLSIGFQAAATVFTAVVPKLIQFWRSESDEDLKLSLPSTIKEFIDQDESSSQQRDWPSVNNHQSSLSIQDENTSVKLFGKVV